MAFKSPLLLLHFYDYVIKIRMERKPKTDYRKYY